MLFSVVEIKAYRNSSFQVLMYTELPVITNKDCKRWYLDIGTDLTDFTSSQVSIDNFHLSSRVEIGRQRKCLVH